MTDWKEIDLDNIGEYVDMEKIPAEKEELVEWIREHAEELEGANELWLDLKTKVISAVEKPAHRSVIVETKNEGKKEMEIEEVVKKVSEKVERKSLITEHDKQMTTEQIALAPALVPNEQDKDGDIIPDFIVERSARRYMEEMRNDSVDEQHETPKGFSEALTSRGTVVESWVLREDRDFTDAKGMNHSYPKGTWMTAIKFDDPDVWEKVENGEIEGWSIMGTPRQRVDNPDDLIREDNFGDNMTDKSKGTVQLTNLLDRYKDIDPEDVDFRRFDAVILEILRAEPEELDKDEFYGFVSDITPGATLTEVTEALEDHFGNEDLTLDDVTAELEDLREFEEDEEEGEGHEEDDDEEETEHGEDETDGEDEEEDVEEEETEEGIEDKQDRLDEIIQRIEKLEQKQNEIEENYAPQEIEERINELFEKVEDEEEDEKDDGLDNEEDPCWENYEMIGRDENGDPICVPEDGAHETRSQIKGLGNEEQTIDKDVDDIRGDLEQYNIDTEGMTDEDIIEFARGLHGDLMEALEELEDEEDGYDEEDDDEEETEHGEDEDHDEEEGEGHEEDDDEEETEHDEDDGEDEEEDVEEEKEVDRKVTENEQESDVVLENIYAHTEPEDEEKEEDEEKTEDEDSDLFEDMWELE